MIKKKITFIPYTCGIGASTLGTEMAPYVLKNKGIEQILEEKGYQVDWHPFFQGDVEQDPHSIRRASEAYYSYIEEHLQSLAHCVEQATHHNAFPICIGGDHAMAIGSLSGIAHAKNIHKRIGVLWIDAHLDAHTPETSPSQSIHGMPVAHLLGYGEKRFIHLLDNKVKLDPKHLCIIGARDYEEEEHNLLKDLGVRIFYMHEINQKGMQRVMEEAKEITSHNTEGVFLSFDLDGLDPSLADAVGTPVRNGINKKDMDIMLSFIQDHIDLLGIDITEYNPSLDQTGYTIETIKHILANLFPNLEKDL